LKYKIAYVRKMILDGMIIKTDFIVLKECLFCMRRGLVFRNIFKAIFFLCIMAVCIFCSAQIFSEGMSRPTKVGKSSVDYMEPDAYSKARLAMGKAMFEAKCASCHTDSGRDMVMFGDPDFNTARVSGSVKKFAGAMKDPEIGEKVYEYLRYNNAGPFMSQNDPFLQPGPLSLEPGVKNPILSKGEDFWGSLTGHKIPTPDDINIDKVWDSYEWQKVAVPFSVLSWSEYLPHGIPLSNARAEVRELSEIDKYDLTKLPLSNNGLGKQFNSNVSSIYKKYQFTSHDITKTDHSKDFLEALSSTSLLSWMAVLDFEYGLPRYINNSWNGKWAFGPYENSILWTAGSTIPHLNSFGMNPDEKIGSQQLIRNKWTHYSNMFVTGKTESFTPSKWFHGATMPWSCKSGDAGRFGGQDIQIFTALKGFAEMWNHSKVYSGTSYKGTEDIPNYGITTRRFLMTIYAPFQGMVNYKYDKKAAVNVLLELVYRQWISSIGATDEDLRYFYGTTYEENVNRDQDRYKALVMAYESLQEAMSTQQKEFVKAYIRRIYPTNPKDYEYGFEPYKWELIEQMPQKPVILSFGSDTAIAGRAYVLRCIRAQAKDGDISITAENLPQGANLIKSQGKWQSDDYEYKIQWTPSSKQAGSSYTVDIYGNSNMGTDKISITIKVVPAESKLELDDIPTYSVYAGQELSFPLTVKNYPAENLKFSMAGNFGKVLNNSWNTAGIYTVRPDRKDTGVHTVTFTVKDKLGNTSSKTAKIYVYSNSEPQVKVLPAGSGPGKNKNIYRVKVGQTLKLTLDSFDVDGDKLEITKNPEFPGYIYDNVYTYKVDSDMAKNFPGPNVLTFTIRDLTPDTNPWYPKYKGGTVKKALLVYFESENASSNHTPWAIAGSPQTVKSGKKVTLDATGSDDSDNDKIKYLWKQVSGPKVSLSDATVIKPSFTAPKVTKPTILKFYLNVTDPGGLSDNGVVRVKVTP